MRDPIPASWAPRHLHEDRLRQSHGRRVPQQHRRSSALLDLHEGQGPPRRPLHHQPHLRHLREQPRDLSCYAQNMAYGVKPPHLGGGSSTSAKPPSTFRTTTSTRRTCSRWTTARRCRSRPTPRARRANNTEHRTPVTTANRTIGDIMRSLNPFTGELLPLGRCSHRYHREMFCLMEGRTSTPVDAITPRGLSGTVATSIVDRLHGG